MFKVTITEYSRRPVTEQAWRKLNETPGNYGYVPPAEGAMERVERNVLTQEVETLDIAAVIKAVNGL